MIVDFLTNLGDAGDYKILDATFFKIIDEFRFFWNRVIGTRGASGKKAINAHSQFANLFDEVGTASVQLEKEHAEEFSEDEIDKLDQLEIEVENDIT